MKYYKFIKDHTATRKEVFDNLKHGGLKLLCDLHTTKRTAQIAWAGDNLIEIIVIENDKVYSHYFQNFPYNDVNQLILNDPKFFENKTWWFGYIED